MADTSSLSKGCFLFKKSTGSPRKRRFHDDELLPVVEGESLAHRKLRHRNYRQCWDNVKGEIEELKSELNSKIFQQLRDYCKRSHTLPHQDKTNGLFREIPTAALITGVNMPDHDVIFSQLAKELKIHVTPFVALLKSKDCTGMKMLLKNAILQFMGCTTQEDGDEDEDELHSATPIKRTTSFTFNLLTNWYKKRIREQSPKKRVISSDTGRFNKCSNPDAPPLVIVFGDFEGFPPVVVQDFVTICSQYIHELPLILVFGVATAITTIHRVLPHAVSSLMSIEKFQAAPSHTCLLEIIVKVLMTGKFPFRLGHKPFRFLYENFLFHDFSLQHFTQGLQFCMMEHFYSNPISVLCCSSAVDRDNIVQELSHTQLELVRRTASYRRYVEREPPEKQLKLLLDDDHTKVVIEQLLEELDIFHWCFFPVLHCLHLLTAQLPRQPLGKRVRDVFEHSLSGNIYEMEEYSEALSLVRVYARDELLPLLRGCVDVLKAAVEDEISARFCESLEEPLEELTSLLQQFEEKSEVRDAVEQQSKSSVVEPLPKPTNRFELQEQLRNAAKLKRKESPFDVLRKKTVQYLDKVFRKFLTCPQKIPLNEVMYYNNFQEVKQHLVGMPRVAIQTALNNPQHYLKCECCKTDVGTIQDTLPDVSIAYKLHLECGRMINLYDWLQAFSVVLNPETPSATSKKKKKPNSDEEIQARFIRAVSELQFLGFIKSTRRKTDHVQRLTWGGC